ncbi:hypothetical protein BU52_10170 [Streptomyces toyocaensis]|uniref:Gram-positive cocci surface proteins LPxTG domain-containing protein n=1 Tax=Streptomyces toyocaensis TaxID=55952 RepID=A0A081XUY9_STRTO|nr:hypothetical protein [Streptomyces toyocaensis]KES07362.1 hypothetical protein BU52_10170 [Streptomyces toyocaensis]
MKLRRAFLTAAVIAPLALLSTPAASAPQEETPTTSTSGPEGASAGTGSEPCVDKKGRGTALLNDDLRSETSDLRFSVVAGGGWETFTFNVRNRSDHEITDIKPLIGAGIMGKDHKDYSRHITVQVLDKATGTWTTLTHPTGKASTLTAFSLGPGQSFSHQLRLRVSSEVPQAVGHVTGEAEYADNHGCWQADDPSESITFFEISPAGAASDSLADTGSSPALSVVGLVGGTAAVAGAGAVFAVRRRKTTTEA